jgi:His-Xaa-Ser system protein HxsD
MKYILEDSIVTIELPCVLYSKETIFKTVYWYGSKFACSVGVREDVYCIDVKCNDEPFDEGSADFFVRKFNCDLIDFETREIIRKETKNIRDMLVAKAFANHDDFEDIPPGTISDPVGFDVNQFLKDPANG